MLADQLFEMLKRDVADLGVLHEDNHGTERRNTHEEQPRLTEAETGREPLFQESSTCSSTRSLSIEWKVSCLSVLPSSSSPTLK